MVLNGKENKVKEDSNDKSFKFSDNDDYLMDCPNSADQDESVECSQLQYPCIACTRSINCTYGAQDNYVCDVKPKVVCDVS